MPTSLTPTNIGPSLRHNNNAGPTAFTLRMTPEGFEAFVQAISAPATPVPEMVASLRRKAPWEKGAAKH